MMWLNFQIKNEINQRKVYYIIAKYIILYYTLYMETMRFLNKKDVINWYLGKIEYKKKRVKIFVQLENYPDDPVGQT